MSLPGSHPTTRRRPGDRGAPAGPWGTCAPTAIVGGMDDLLIPPGPGAPHGLTVPAAELVEQFSHASGPGGQGVNTTDSRVRLSLDLGTTSALDDRQRERVLAALGHRLTGTVLMINAAEHRSQRQNRAAARERLATLLREAVVPPVVRRPTKRTRGSHRRRLAAKRERAEIKQARRRPRAD